MTEPIPRLRRDPSPSTTSGRKVLIGVAAFFLLLLAFVLTLVFTIGLSNNGVKIPTSTQSPSSLPGAASVTAEYFAIDADSGAEAYVSDKAVYRAQRHKERAVTVGADADGRTGYFAVPRPGCRTALESVRAGAAIMATRIGTIDGRARSVPMAVSADGTKVALVLDPRTKQANCATRAELFVYDLRSRVLMPVAGSDMRAPITSLAWGAGDGQLAVLTFGTVRGGGAVRVINVDSTARGSCARCLLPRGTSVGSAQVVLWWHDRFVVIAEGEIRTFSSVGLGSTLGTGLPESVTSVSVAPDGARLLMSAGLQTVAEPGDIRYGTTYVWSDGHATALSSGHWDDPVW